VVNISLFFILLSSINFSKNVKDLIFLLNLTKSCYSAVNIMLL